MTRRLLLSCLSLALLVLLSLEVPFGYVYARGEVAAALGEVQGTATSAELDDGNGRSSAWHVEVIDAKGAEHEVTVDAGSGRVTVAQADDHHDRPAGTGTDSDRRED